MVCTANELQEWKDFPKGLRVLLLGEDIDSASDIRSKLEAMDYIVSIFCSETEAASAFSSKPESFHLAIVEVNTNNGDGTFKFLETAKELPIIMASNTNCLKTMMKCISLGAVEFLRKPLSEDKLKNIWQHVVHKAFNAGGRSNPGNESLALPNPNLKLEEREPDEKVSGGPEIPSEAIEHEVEKYPAPSTPQLSQGVRLTGNGNCQDQNYCCIADKEDCEYKSVETTSRGDSVAEVIVSMEQQETIAVVKEEEEGCVEVPKSSDETSSDRRNSESPRKRHGDIENPSKVLSLSNSSLSKYSRKKMKVDWTPELHKKFVHAVEQLGVDQAIPSRILELMKVEGLTRHNVASHLQKYRMHKRHILPKEDERRWPRPGDPAVQRHCYPQQHVMAYPTYHSNHSAHLAPVYPMWGQPGGHPASVPMWGLPSYPSWQPAESWHWKSYPAVHADAWGCPVVPPLPPHAPYALYPQNVPRFPSTSTIDSVGVTPQNSFDLQPADEVIDKVVKEAINKPWLPLPLGLKPPSTDSVLSELSRQGISTIPPKLSPS